jgi:hypothetical protein
MAIIARVRRKVGLGEDPNPWVHNQGRAIRSEGYTGWIRLPDFLEAIPGVADELRSHWLLEKPVKYARQYDGGWLVAVWDKRDALHNDYVWMFQIYPEGGTTQTGSTQGGSGQSGGSTGSLPPGAPPANGAGPLGRLRGLMRKRGL